MVQVRLPLAAVGRETCLLHFVIFPILKELNLRPAAASGNYLEPEGISHMSATGTIVGGLGNQLFIVCATLAHAQRHGKQPWFLAQSSYGKRPGYWGSVFANIADLALADGPPPKAVFREPHHAFCDIPGDADCLEGYFQSELYFKEFAVDIFRRLGLAPLRAQLAPLLDQSGAAGRPRISLHLRIGDYAALQECHPLLPYAYYHRALEYIGARACTVSMSAPTEKPPI